MVVHVEYFQHKENTFMNPGKEVFYQWMVEYFQAPFLQKIPSSETFFSIYICPIQCLLLNEKRYLVVLVDTDQFPIGTIRPLHELRWHSLQTRILLTDFGDMKVSSHSYQVSRDSKFTLRLLAIKRSKDSTDYTVPEYDPPLLLTLLHTKGIEYEYPDSGTLVSALETFQTIVQWK